jgi:2,3-bisphosphoglycerate-dependent phosphoglycerate mutase
MANLILIRHGESEWNLENRFTGSVDVDITSRGVQEAKHAAFLIRDYRPDVAYTSVLRRAVHTLAVILDAMGIPDLTVIRTAAFNERNYGDLQGLNKSETEKIFGARQVNLWRRSYGTAPPNWESLKDTYHRVVPFFQQHIEADLNSGKTVLIVAHGNSLRALMMYLENIDASKISEVYLPTGVPRLYQFDQNLTLKNAGYLELNAKITDTFIASFEFNVK